MKENPMMARRFGWLAALTIALSVLTASCSLSPSSLTTPSASADSPANQPTASAAEDFQTAGTVKVDQFNDQATGKEVPRDGGQIVVRFNAEPATLSPWLATSDAVSSYISTEYIYDTLLWQNHETFDMEPRLAESWFEEDVVVEQNGAKVRGKASQRENGDVEVARSDGAPATIRAADVKDVRKGAAFTFHLRKDVLFHDGKPLTAADVKFSLDTVLNESVDAPDMRQQYMDVESYEVLDPYTIRVTFGKQFWMARINLGKMLEILPKHLYDWDDLQEKDPKAFGKRFNESEYHRKPIGTGPYKFERWDTGQQVVVVRNDHYWNKNRRGHLDRIVFRFISDPVPALQALKNGDVNFIAGRLTPEQYDTEMSDPEFLRKFAKVEFYTPGFCWTGWNMRHPPLDDPRVRQALSYGALDLDKFIREVLHGHAIRINAYQYFFGPAYDHSVSPYPYDPEKAKQLLLDAGWYDHDGDGLRDKNAQPFRFEYLIPTGSPVTERRAAIMKENLRKLGIDMTIRELEWATFLQDLTDRKFDSCYLCWAGDPESDPYQIWHTSQAEGRGSNYVGFGNAETDRIIEESRRTLDAVERRRLLSQLDHILYETQPYQFLYLVADLGAYDKKYRGVKFYKLRPGYDLTEWYLSKESVKP
jgi:peptide/nickel transport system substrate-binding protein